MRKTENNISENLIESEDKKIKKCEQEKAGAKCVGIILFYGFGLGISFYSGISYSNYLNDNSLSF